MTCRHCGKTIEKPEVVEYTDRKVWCSLICWKTEKDDLSAKEEARRTFLRTQMYTVDPKTRNL